jgi:hypothetical protein
MRNAPTDAVRELVRRSPSPGAPLKRLPRRTTQTTKQMHRRLLRALDDRRIKRIFD